MKNNSMPPQQQEKLSLVQQEQEDKSLSLATHSSKQTVLQAANTHSSEPSLWVKLLRRTKVFWVAGSVFLSYKWTQIRQDQMRKRLGLVPAKIDDNDDDDDNENDDQHPDLEPLWNEAHARNAQRLLTAMEDLQGFWIKIGQYLSSRADVMPRAYLQTLASLQDGVPAKSFDDIMATLDEELSPDQQRALLVSIDATPLSTASLAQVHRAVLTDGRQVVIKAQHRGVASLMRQDMDNLATILDWLSKTDPDLDYTPVVKEYTAEVTKELDFRREAENMQQVKTLLQDQGIRAVVPETILATEKIIVMEYCAGYPIRDVKQLDHYQVDRYLLLQRVVQAWAAQIHVLGTFNADPHAGNILVSTAQPDGDMAVPVLLDFGLTKRLLPSMKLAFARMVHAAYATDVDGLLQSFNEMGLQLNRYDPFQDMAAIQSSLADPVPESQASAINKEKRRQRQADQEAMRQDQGVAKGQKLRNPVDAWPPEIIFFTRVTAMLRGLCSRLQVSYPYLQGMAKAAAETLREAVPEDERAKTLVHAPVQHLDTHLQRCIERVAEELLQNDQAVGLQVFVIQNGEILANVAAGTLGTVNPRPVTPTSLFNVFSVSKAILSTGVLVLLHEKGISVDDAIAKHWPAFGESHPDKKHITIRHALSHQSGLANAFPDGVSIDVLTDWNSMKDFIAVPDAVPSHPPGQETHYHYLTFAWVLGGLIEEVTGEPYEHFLQKHLIEPLGLSDELHMAGIPKHIEMEKLAVLTSHALKKTTRNSAPRVDSESGDKEKQPSKRLAKFQGREQLMNPSVFNMQKVRASKLPSANGHASARALACLMDAAISERGLVGILPRSAFKEARTPQRTTTDSSAASAFMLDNAKASFGLGFQVHDITLSDGTVARSMGHSGFGGSVVLGIPELKLSIAVTTNQLAFQSAVRQRMLESVFASFELEIPTSLAES